MFQNTKFPTGISSNLIELNFFILESDEVFQSRLLMGQIARQGPFPALRLSKGLPREMNAKFAAFLGHNMNNL